jgi:hypothetical protein
MILIILENTSKGLFTRSIIKIGEGKIHKLTQDGSTQTEVEYLDIGCQFTKEFKEQEVQAIQEFKDCEMQTDEVAILEEIKKQSVKNDGNLNSFSRPGRNMQNTLNNEQGENKRNSMIKKKIFKAENSIDLSFYNQFAKKESLILHAKYRKDSRKKSNSSKFSESFMTDSEEGLDMSFSSYSFEGKNSKFRTSRLYRKLTDVELKNLHIHSVLKNSLNEKEKQYVSSKRINKIAVHVFHRIIVQNDMSDVMSIIYDYFSEKTKRDAHAISILKAVYNYCSIRESGNRTKIDMFIKLIPFKMMNLISTFKEILKGLYSHLDD